MWSFRILAVFGLTLAFLISQASFPSLADDKQPDLLSAGAKAGQEWSGNDLKMKFCWCPPGEFTMGSPKDEPGRETWWDVADDNQFQVVINRGFWMGKYEVTQAEWQRVMGTTIEQQRAYYYRTAELHGQGDEFPMYYVSQKEAARFCSRLTKLEQASGRLPAGWEYQLPTEEQWEYACRAGTKTATAFGGTLDLKQANFDGVTGANLGATVPVGSYAPNAWGLCDMHGNVKEWCDEVYFETDLRDDRVEVPGLHGVARGGSWPSDGAKCRSASREYLRPGTRSGTMGFRVVLVQVSQ